jgi:DNA-binding GntR family transcriptional regulator
MPALPAAAGSPIVERLRLQLEDAFELYRSLACNMAHHPTRAHVDEDQVIFDAALAREAESAVDVLSQHLEATARHLEAIAPMSMPNRRRSTRLPTDGPGPGGVAPGR